MIDFVDELGHAPSNRVFCSVEALKEAHNCTAECGIVQVDVIKIESVPDLVELIRTKKFRSRVKFGWTHRIGYFDEDVDNGKQIYSHVKNAPDGSFLVAIKRLKIVRDQQFSIDIVQKK